MKQGGVIPDEHGCAFRSAAVLLEPVKQLVARVGGEIIVVNVGKSQVPVVRRESEEIEVGDLTTSSFENFDQRQEVRRSHMVSVVYIMGWGIEPRQNGEQTRSRPCRGTVGVLKECARL